MDTENKGNILVTTNKDAGKSSWSAMSQIQDMERAFL